MQLRNQQHQTNNQNDNTMDDPVSGYFSCFNQNSFFNCTNWLWCGETMSQCLTRSCAGIFTCCASCIPQLCDVFGIQGDVSAQAGGL